MFIRCDSCGKLFNYEKNDGVCPHCAAFNSPPAPGGEPEQASVSYEAAEPQPFSEEAEEEETFFSPQPSVSASPAADKPRSRKSRRGCGCVLAVLLALVIAVIGVQIWQRVTRKDRWTEQMQQTEAPSVQAFEAGQTVQIGPYTACAAGAAVIALPEGSEQLPEGEMAVGIQMDFAVDDEYPDSDPWYHSLIPAPYVMLEDGRCRTMMDTWLLSSYSSPLYSQCVEVDALYYGDEGSGMVYFVVPAGTDTVTLCLEQREPSDNSLTCIYELTLPVTEVSE